MRWSHGSRARRACASNAKAPSPGTPRGFATAASWPIARVRCRCGCVGTSTCRSPPGQTLAEGVAGLAPGDMVPIIGLRRRPAGVAEFARAVAASGADAAPVADRSARVSPAQARRTIFCAGGGAPAARHPCRRDGAAALALRTMRRLGLGGRRRLQRIATLHDTLGRLERRSFGHDRAQEPAGCAAHGTGLGTPPGHSRLRAARRVLGRAALAVSIGARSGKVAMISRRSS